MHYFVITNFSAHLHRMVLAGPLVDISNHFHSYVLTVHCPSVDCDSVFPYRTVVPSFHLNSVFK